jgi:hypothetical protein
LQARGETFYDLLRHTFRFLAHKRRTLDWTDIVRLCLLHGKNRENFLRKLARDFCLAQRKQSDEHPEERLTKQQGAAS